MFCYFTRFVLLTDMSQMEKSCVYLMKNVIEVGFCVFFVRESTDHWSFATAPCRASLQPEYVSAPWSESFHYEEPLG